MYDVIVIGLGAMGSATAWQLARRGRRVLGLDRWQPPHDLGSSHGETRLIRLAYAEGPAYVPLLQRAYELWEELETITGRATLVQTGGLLLGPPEGELIAGTLATAATCGLTVETLEAGQLGRRFPQFRPPDGFAAVFEPAAGALLVENCVQAHLDLARTAGAELHYGEGLTSWTVAAGRCHVTTAAGRYEAERLVLASGAWLVQHARPLALPLTVERLAQHWFAAAGDRQAFQHGACPAFAIEHVPGSIFYGFPMFQRGIKVACHEPGVVIDPSAARPPVTPEEVERIRGLLARLAPGAAGRYRASASCLYTRTPDSRFILDRHPDHEQVLLLSCCSGHGFKFSSVIGEIAADLLLEGRCAFDLTPFRLDRFAT